MATLDELYPPRPPAVEQPPVRTSTEGAEGAEGPREVTVEDVLATLNPFAYVSGRAGTGKTTLAQRIAEGRRDTVLCATTGIAAVNLGQATTLNSLLHYFDTAGLQKHQATGYLRYRLDKLRASGLRIILLDEVSMLPADQLTCLVQGIEDLQATSGYDRSLSTFYYDETDDMTLKLLLVGDFAQLPPVEAPYAFEAAEWDRFAGSTHTLQKVWRQENQRFADALHAIRLGKGAEAVGTLAPSFAKAVDINFDGTTIVAKNADVDLINKRRHDALPGTPIPWATIRSGEQQKDWLRQIPEAIALKPGALVMTLMNRVEPCFGDEMARDYLYVNGDLGTVVEADETRVEVEGQPTKVMRQGIKVLIHRTDEVQTVVPHTKEWEEPVSPPTPVDKAYVGKPGEVIQIKVDDAGKSQRFIVKQIKGAVTYLPLRLAYATTVHKSQGLSLDTVQVAIGDWMFTKPGMLYVALSRCRDLGGLRIVGNARMLVGRCGVDPKVRRFL